MARTRMTEVKVPRAHPGAKGVECGTFEPITGRWRTPRPSAPPAPRTRT